MRIETTFSPGNTVFLVLEPHPRKYERVKCSACGGHRMCRTKAREYAVREGRILRINEIHFADPEDPEGSKRPAQQETYIVEWKAGKGWAYSDFDVPSGRSDSIFSLLFRTCEEAEAAIAVKVAQDEADRRAWEAHKEEERRKIRERRKRRERKDRLVKEDKIIKPVVLAGLKKKPTKRKV